MASPQRFSEITNPGDEPMLLDEGFEIVEEEPVELTANADESEMSDSSGGLLPWILFGLLVTGCTATVLFVGLPMHDELEALRADKHRLSAELKASQEREEALAAEVDTLDATRARLTAAVAQKTVELEDAVKIQNDLKRALRDEIKKNEQRRDTGTSQTSRGRRSRRR